jgi:hypothetical protein
MRTFKHFHCPLGVHIPDLPHVWSLHLGIVFRRCGLASTVGVVRFLLAKLPWTPPLMGVDSSSAICSGVAIGLNIRSTSASRTLGVTSRLVAILSAYCLVLHLDYILLVLSGRCQLRSVLALTVANRWDHHLGVLGVGN